MEEISVLIRVIYCLHYLSHRNIILLMRKIQEVIYMSCQFTACVVEILFQVVWKLEHILPYKQSYKLLLNSKVNLKQVGELSR